MLYLIDWSCGISEICFQTLIVKLTCKTFWVLNLKFKNVHGHKVQNQPMFILLQKGIWCKTCVKCRETGKMGKRSPGASQHETRQASVNYTLFMAVNIHRLWYLNKNS